MKTTNNYRLGGFVPHRLAINKETKSVIELISYPFEENGKILICVRETPNDPTTLNEVSIHNLLLVKKKGAC